MNAQLCSRPGRAKRGGGFNALRRECQQASLSPITRIDLDRAVAQGTPGLSPGARCLLAFYASHLSLDAPGKTSVFPGTSRATACLGISPATLRRHKAELEEAGFLIRCYDRRNRPLEGGAIDLRPLLSKVPAILASLSSDLQTQWEGWRSSRAPDKASELSTQELTIEPLNSTNKSSENSSFHRDELRAGKTTEPPVPSSSTTADDRDLITQVLVSSPKLRAALPDAFDAQSPDPTGPLRAVLPVLFPQETAASIGHTGLWAEQRLGAAMFAAAAIAVEDPEVRRPAAYFGRLVTKAEGYDPAENLKRLRQLNPVQERRKPHGCDDAERFIAKLEALIGEWAAASWFDPKVVTVRVSEGWSKLTPKTGFAARQIRDRFQEPLHVVAKELSLEGAEVLDPSRAIAGQPAKGHDPIGEGRLANGDRGEFKMG